jgi:hypothetical protein
MLGSWALHGLLQKGNRTVHISTELRGSKPHSAHAGSPEQVQVDAESGRHLIAPLGPFGSLQVLLGPFDRSDQGSHLSCLISLLVLCRFWNWNHDVVFLSFFQ